MNQNSFEFLDPNFDPNNKVRKRNTVEQKYIKELLDEGIGRTVIKDVCKSFNDYVCQSYSWEITGYRIDWDKHPSCKRFYWLSSSDEETATFLRNSCLSLHEKACVVYSPNEPGLIVDFKYAQDNVDVLTCHASGLAFLVAVTNEISNLEVPNLLYDCFIEVDRDYWITEA
ncbi:MAG: hypothetical protein AAF383_04480 [Cyanobacteria bacterium P01_A01_bin.83]